MRMVTPERMQNFLSVMTGSTTPAANGAAVETKTLNLCKTRVHAIIFADGKKVEEFKQGLEMKWMAHDPTPREIYYLDVEKWLGKYCRIQVEASTESPKVELPVAVTVEFIDQSKELIHQEGATFIVGGTYFRSEEFANALVELRHLAQFE